MDNGRNRRKQIVFCVGVMVSGEYFCGIFLTTSVYNTADRTAPNRRSIPRIETEASAEPVSVIIHKTPTKEQQMPKICNFERYSLRKTREKIEVQTGIVAIIMDETAAVTVVNPIVSQRK